MKTLFIDGGCTGNGQKDISIRKMVSVVTDEIGKVLDIEESTGGSNNIAEFIALKNAVKYLSEKGISKALIITDSMNNIAWFKRFKAKKQNDAERVAEIRKEIYSYLGLLGEIKLEWCPRDENLAGHYIEETYNL